MKRCRNRSAEMVDGRFSTLLIHGGWQHPFVDASELINIQSKVAVDLKGAAGSGPNSVDRNPFAGKMGFELFKLLF